MSPPETSPRKRPTAESIRRATENARSVADELACRSIVLPAVGCENGGFYIREGGALIRRTIRSYDPEVLEDMRVIGYTDRERNALEAAASELTGSR
ncbi:hypothetical protein [Natronococcus sp. A-GB7]|uniref:macro domain-containing protein n=1 Tax=Natronococcus sp. A-GB7 TaxID=3037649 RepID=UPI00241EA712|nr:hypothetical protein [Natronococcus sp. A-GB7]MDG5818266.1 hypothetical protein [Natronococcus sp. A-GB7]